MGLQQQALGSGRVMGRWQEALPSGRLRCTLCPRACELLEGQRGYCFVRERRGDSIELTSYGRTSGLAIDPIEKKPLYHFFPGSSVLSFGTAGCNLGCRFCQNWEISKARDTGRLATLASPDEIAVLAVRRTCRSVAFTYNDPVVFAEFAMDTALCCNSRGIAAVAVTAGYLQKQARREFFAPMSAANVDLKAYAEDFYRRLCAGELEPVKDTLRYLVHDTRVWTEITTLLIPGENDTDEELKRLVDFILTELGPSVPLHFTAFRPMFRLLDRPRTEASRCKEARKIARSMGLLHVYTGNVDDDEGQSTYCSQCGKVLIARRGYQIRVENLVQGCCGVCQTPLAGVWGG